MSGERTVMADTNRLGRLPWELLEKIVEQLPAPDIRTFGKVTRGFHNFIRGSPRIQHKLDLWAVGLEPNWSTSLTLVDRVKALEEYRTRWKSADVDKFQTTMRSFTSVAVGGVFGIPLNDEIQFYTLPSSLRAIEPTSHKIRFGFGVAGFAFHPQEDVVVVAVPGSRIIELHLITMSGGVPHPSALKKLVENDTGSASLSYDVSLSITGYRLASMLENSDTNTIQLNVWDWRTGELLFERHSPYYKSIEFLDDYRLVISVSPSGHAGSPSLLLLDTEWVSHMVPAQTLFHGPVSYRHWTCLFEAGGYNASAQDILATPFYPAPSQRILALSTDPQGWFCVMKVEALLKFARERAGEEVQWEEWKPYLAQIFLEGTSRTVYNMGPWVSGFRLFFVSAQNDGRCDLHVYDFSSHACTKFLPREGNDVMCVGPVVGHRLPWQAGDIYDITFCHDSMIVQLSPSPSANVSNVAPDIGSFWQFASE